MRKKYTFAAPFSAVVFNGLRATGGGNMKHISSEVL
jgi:hypothetical protein